MSVSDWSSDVCSSDLLKIGVDAMGGDFAPEAAVKGAVMAVDAIGDE